MCIHDILGPAKQALSQQQLKHFDADGCLPHKPLKCHQPLQSVKLECKKMLSRVISIADCYLSWSFQSPVQILIEPCHGKPDFPALLTTLLFSCMPHKVVHKSEACRIAML